MDTLAKRMADIALPYENTDVDLLFMLSGGVSVVALYRRGDVSRSFVGFGHPDPAGTARAAKEIHGVYAAYVVNAVSK